MDPSPSTGRAVGSSIPSRLEERELANDAAGRDPSSFDAMPFWAFDPSLRRRVLLASARLDWPLAGDLGRPEHDLDELHETAFVSLLDGIDSDATPEFSVEAAVNTLHAVTRLLRDGTWEDRPSRPVRALQRSAERAVDDLARDLGRAPTVVQVTACLTLRGEDVLKSCGTATDRSRTGLDPEAIEEVAPLPAVGNAADAEALLKRGALARDADDVEEQSERIARLQFERDMARTEPAHRRAQIRIRRTGALAHGLALLDTMQLARTPTVATWATCVLCAGRGQRTPP